ncbi:MAG: hypothetical protein IPP29_13790 [Bacteroidetes bacterium]|nr:hypothetical protein [Bacteroidota bacterium]
MKSIVTYGLGNSGSTNVFVNGVYGIKGIPSSMNNPAVDSKLVLAGLMP